MKQTFLGLFAISLFTISCKKDERPTYLKDEAGIQAPVINNTQKVSILDQAGIQNTQQTVTPISGTTVTAPGMNPPHGQPGHNCAIPVGQPLNGNSQAPKAQVTQNPNGTQSIQIDPNSLNPGKFALDKNGKTVKTAPGMNPPHGEPGHRCDIPVGQPLNSKPQTSPVTPQPQQNTVQTPAPTQQPLAQGEKPKLNPAHGEPWHDCALKVGEPLP
ncbi:hypothetical protein [Chryseobacterium oryctis]|uniref:Uncharacterized protein n=1 Tax=Chryseobacterium oryctis TaxID=2952618 RepID=A0ABT3HL15_9FLAO|nr:hypothetical protein [Chryseobacterium oryctis]MCW3160490.1 hypothetical protein [Chryseobacterium oryctis]